MWQRASSCIKGPTSDVFRKGKDRSSAQGQRRLPAPYRSWSKKGPLCASTRVRKVSVGVSVGVRLQKSVVGQRVHASVRQRDGRWQHKLEVDTLARASRQSSMRSRRDTRTCVMAGHSTGAKLGPASGTRVDEAARRGAATAHGCDKGCLCCGNEAGGERLLEQTRGRAQRGHREGSPERQRANEAQRCTLRPQAQQPQQNRDSSKAKHHQTQVESRRRMVQMTRIKGAGRVADEPATEQQLVPARIQWRSTTSGGSYT